MIISDFLDNEEIDKVLSFVNRNTKKDGNFGSKCHFDKKRRYEYSLESHSLLDEKLLSFQSQLFDYQKQCYYFREKWKYAEYNGDNKGFYCKHNDIQGNMLHRKLSCIVMLSNDTDYTGGTLCFENNNTEYKLKKGSLIVFDSSLFHWVKPVENGIRKIVLTFLFNLEGSEYKPLSYLPFYSYLPNHQYLLPLVPNSGPGNQLISIKENLFIAKLLHRILIIPPIHSHYTSSTKHIWKFQELFNIKDYFTVSPEEISWLQDTNYNIYGLSSQFLNLQLKSEKYFFDEKKNVEKKYFLLENEKKKNK